MYSLANQTFNSEEIVTLSLKTLTALCYFQSILAPAGTAISKANNQRVTF